MTTKHTPGPWAINNPDHENFVTIGSSSVRNIADVWAINGDCTEDERDANACLIAAAPELLEAAKLVLAWYEAEDDHSNTNFYQRMEMCRTSEAALRSAIAKATGSEA